MKRQDKERLQEKFYRDGVQNYWGYIGTFQSIVNPFLLAEACPTLDPTATHCSGISVNQAL